MKEKYFVIGESRNGGQRHASVWIGVDEDFKNADVIEVFDDENSAYQFADEWNSQFYSID